MADIYNDVFQKKYVGVCLESDYFGSSLCWSASKDAMWRWGKKTGYTTTFDSCTNEIRGLYSGKRTLELA